MLLPLSCLRLIQTLLQTLRSDLSGLSMVLQQTDSSFLLSFRSDYLRQAQETRLIHLIRLLLMLLQIQGNSSSSLLKQVLDCPVNRCFVVFGSFVPSPKGSSCMMGLMAKLLSKFLLSVLTSLTLKQNSQMIIKQQTDVMLLISSFKDLPFFTIYQVAIPNFHGWLNTQKQKILTPRHSPTSILVCCWLTSIKQPYFTEKSSLAISIAAKKSEGGKAWVTLDCTRNSKISLVTVDLLSFSETQYSICVTSFSCCIFGRSSACSKMLIQFASSSFSSFSQQHRISFSIKTNKFLQHFQALRFRFIIVSFILASIRFRKTTAQTAPLNFLLEELCLYFLGRSGRRKGSGCAKILDIGLLFSGRVSYRSLSNLIQSSKGRLVWGVLSVISSLKSYFFLSVYGQSSSSRAFSILFLWMFRWRMWLIRLSTSSILAYYYKKGPAPPRSINRHHNWASRTIARGANSDADIKEKWSGLDGQIEIYHDDELLFKLIRFGSRSQIMRIDGADIIRPKKMGNIYDRNRRENKVDCLLHETLREIRAIKMISS